MSKENDWIVSYSSITFLERALNAHKCVNHFGRTNDVLFLIDRTRGLPSVRALLVNVYTLGLADIFRAKDEYPEFDCIVNSADWNHYSDEAKIFGMKNQLGIFTISEFLGALWLKYPHEYAKSDRHIILSIIAGLPENSDIYVFGSFLTSDDPSDLDVLLVYDETIISPAKAPETFDPMVEKLQKVIECKVDLTLLSRSEEKTVDFINHERCKKMQNEIYELLSKKK